MLKFALVIIALIGLGSPAIGAAPAKLEPRTRAILACASVAAEDARLRCYDESVVALQQAVGQGDVVLKEKKGPKALGGVVTASGSMGDNRYWIDLDSGERWQLLPTTIRNGAPPKGLKIEVRKGIASNYWISGAGWTSSPARFVRRLP